jgi:hypothetical protein
MKVPRVDRKQWVQVQSNTWNYWNGGTTTGTNIITPATNRTWDQWVNVGTSYTTSTTLTYDVNYTWQRWEHADNAYRQATAEEIRELAARRQEAEDRRQRQREEENARRLANMERMAGAEDRAETLFRSLLTAEQLVTLDDENTSCVIERGSDGGIYQIQVDGRLHGNIKAIDEHGCVLGTLCVAPDMYTGNGRMPNMDGYVGQLLAIRFNEPALLAKANWSGRRPCQHLAVPIIRAA